MSWGGKLHRRSFLRTGGRALLAVAAASTQGGNIGSAQAAAIALDGIEERVERVVEAYDAQGNHRTATSVDNESAEWLAQQIRQLGAEPALEPFAITRIDPISCHLRIAGRRIEGVPLYDAAFTGPEGVSGALGPAADDSDIVLAETEPFTLTSPRRELGGALAAARRGRHKGIIVLTRGSRPGLFLLNAPSFTSAFGPPGLQVSTAEEEWVKARMQEHAQVKLVSHVRSTSTQAFNVTVRIAGSDPGLEPLVITTPRSGWWQCASERGGGLACWLESMRALMAARPARDCLFAAFSGHEVGFLGIGAYLGSRPNLMKRARTWIHIGANIGAPRQQNQVHVSEASLERWLAAAFQNEGLGIDHLADSGSVPRGEAGTLHRGGARYVALVCGTEVFHNPADRWPDALDITTLARYATALARGVAEIAG